MFECIWLQTDRSELGSLALCLANNSQHYVRLKIDSGIHTADTFYVSPQCVSYLYVLFVQPLTLFVLFHTGLLDNCKPKHGLDK